MKVDIAPPFPLPGLWPDRACAEMVYEFDGQRYYLKQLDRHIQYRTADQDSVQQTLYVPCRAIPNLPQYQPNQKINICTPSMYPESLFRKHLQGGESGRLARYSCPHARDCLAALFFAQDGTGMFLDYGMSNWFSGPKAMQTVEFVWRGDRHGIPTFADILTCDWDTLLPLCEEVFTQQVWQQMENPFAAVDEFPDEPLVFRCGSQSELELITRCVCHVNADAFEDVFEKISEQEGVDVIYYAYTSKHKRGGIETILGLFSSPLDAYGKSLCRMAFTHNSFQGGTWRPINRKGGTRRTSYHLDQHILAVNVAPPSAHEQAEALLTLYDWLENKVTDQERRRLLRLDAPAVNTEDEE